MKINGKNFISRIVVALDSPTTILIASLVALFWLQGKYLFSGTDTFFPLARIDSIRNLFYTWSIQSTGMPMSAQSVMLPYGLFLMISEKMGLTLVFTQSLWFYYLLALSGISMYLLSKEVFVRSFNTVPRLIPIFTSLLYMANPFVTSMASAYSYLWLTYAAMPLKIYLLMGILNKKTKFKTMILSLIIWNVIASSQYTNPKYLILDLLPAGLMLLVFVSGTKGLRDKLHLAKQFLVFLTLLFLTNAYWLFPSLKMIGGAIRDTKQAYSEISLTRDIGHGLNSSVGIVRGFTLTGLWALPGGTKEVPYFKFYDYLSSLPILFISLIPVFLVCLCVLFSNSFKYKVTVTLFGILNAISFFGMLGSHPSVVGIDTLLKRLPLYLEIFSYPFQIYGIFFVLSLFVLASLGAYMVIDRFRLASSITKSLLVVLTSLLLVFLYGKQVWTGELLSPRSWETNNVIPTNLYRIPEYYFDLRNRLAGDKNQYRILSIPYSKTSGMVYLWEDGYAGIDITPGFLGNVLYGTNHATEALLTKISGKNDINSEIKALGITSFIFHNDGHDLMVKDPKISESDLEETLISSKIEFNKEKYGKIDLYLLHIKPEPIIYFDGGELGNENIEIERINNSKIEVSIRGIKTTERIILRETYNENWTVSFVDNKDHFRALGYANGWTIDPFRICENSTRCTNNQDGSYDFKITLEFRPQRLLYLGSIVSIASYVGCFTYLLLIYRKSRNKNDK